MDENDNLGLISQHISRLLGLHFHEKQLESMGRSVMKAALELKRDTQPGSLHMWLENSSLSGKEIDTLARYLSVGETYFFREKTGLELFTNEIIPGFRKQDPEQAIRIWSAGCSSGEEPYTLAMLLHENMPDLSNRNIRILASDLNAEALEKAKKGVYSAWSFRDTPEVYKNKYFTPQGKHFEIRKEIRQMVTFFQLNLAGPAYPSPNNGTQDLDVIFCRNVLMYFLPEMAIGVAKRFYQALKQDAWLITSQVELHEEYYNAFKKVRYKQGIFYRKSQKEEKPKLPFNRLKKQPDETGAVEIKIPAIKRLKREKSLKRKYDKRPKDILKKDTDSPDLSVPKSQPAGVTDVLKQAEKLFAEAQYGACAESCRAYMEKNAFEKRVGELLVRSLANLGKHAEARQWAEKLISADGEHAGYLNLFATILMEQGDMLMAEKTLIKTLYINPQHVHGLFNMFCVLNALGKNKLANKYYDNLLSGIDHLEDHNEVSGLEGMTAGVVRTLAKNNTGNDRIR